MQDDISDRELNEAYKEGFDAGYHKGFIDGSEVSEERVRKELS